MYSPQGTDMGAQVKFLKTMPSGELLFSVAPNQVMGIQNNLLITYDYTSFEETFTVLDAADQMTDGGTRRLLLTAEGSSTSMRGHCKRRANARHVHVVRRSVARASTATAFGWPMGRTPAHRAPMVQSPATPESRPVLGWILWNGDDATPVLRSVQMFASGVFHSVAHAAGDYLLLEAPLRASSSLRANRFRPLSTLLRGSWGMQMEPCGSLGPLAQPASPRTTALVEVHQLSRHVPVDVTDAGVQGVAFTSTVSTKAASHSMVHRHHC